VIGDSVLWADPEKNFRSLVPAIPMLWASLAMVRPPADDANVLGTQIVDSLTHQRRVVWRFAQAEDTLDYVVTDSAGRESMLEAEWRRRGKLVARSRAKLDALQRPASARVDFPEGPARFELTVVWLIRGRHFAGCLAHSSLVRRAWGSWVARINLRAARFPTSKRSPSCRSTTTPPNRD